MSQQREMLWWVVPKTLAGMPMPFLHPDRRMAGGGEVDAYPDELIVLQSAGIRAVVSLLNIPTDKPVYESAGFAFLCIPVADGAAPSKAQVQECLHFVRKQISLGRAVAVHCEAGIGRTGTLLAAYLISEGETAGGAIKRVRAVEPSAVETNSQIRFLEQLAFGISNPSDSSSGI